MFEECALYSFSTGDRFHEKAMTPQGVGVCFSYFQAHPSILFIAVAVVPANLCEVAPKACYNSSFCFGGLMSGVFLPSGKQMVISSLRVSYSQLCKSYDRFI